MRSSQLDQPLAIRLLDVGGEGRYPNAWNLNPSSTKTIGPEKGEPIPHRINGRAEAIPLPNDSVLAVIVERTPLRSEAIDELLRVVIPRGILVLRHHDNGLSCPHQRMLQRSGGTAKVRTVRIGQQRFHELVIRNPTCHIRSQVVEKSAR